MAIDRERRPHLMGYGGEVKIDRPISVFDGKDFTVLTAGAGFPAGLETGVLAFDADGRMLMGGAFGLRFGDGTMWKMPGGLGRLAEVRTIAVDGDVVWAGARRGLHRIQGGQSKHFPTKNGVKCVLLDGHVLWAGLSYGGVVRIDGDEVTTYTQESAPGLTEEDVAGLALAPDGTLWISANDKVFCWNGGALGAFGGKPLAPIVSPDMAAKAAAPPVATRPAKPKKRIVKSDETIVLMQIDAEMKGPKKLQEVWSYWGGGIAHFVISKKNLLARKLDKAGATLAYT